jgi:2-methylcitrate dehydratase PrpD
MTLTRDIVEDYCAIDHARIDDAALDAAKVALADGLAVMVAATGLEPASRPFMNYAAASGDGPSTLIGMGCSVSPVHAALANGALAHAIDFEDTFEEGMIHPNASLIPAVIALAESEKSDGQTVLAALALGCDFACRLSLTLDGDPAGRGWYHPPILSGLGATLGCSVLLGLDANGMRNALGLFAAQFMLGDELKRSPKSDLRAVREGLAARAAVESALLARAGVEAVEEPLEGPSGVFRLLTGNPPKAGAFADIGQRYWGPEVGIKLWPACRGTHGAVVAAQRLRDKGIAPADIVRVGVEVSPPNDMLFEPRAQRIAPQTAIDAKFSIPFVLAAALEDGAVSLASFSTEAICKQSTLDLAERVHFDGMLPRGAGEGVYTVMLENGSSMTEEIEAVPVWRARDIELADLAGKVGDCLKAGRRPVEPSAFLARIADVGATGVGPVVALL